MRDSVRRWQPCIAGHMNPLLQNVPAKADASAHRAAHYMLGGAALRRHSSVPYSLHLRTTRRQAQQRRPRPSTLRIIGVHLPPGPQPGAMHYATTPAKPRSLLPGGCASASLSAQQQRKCAPMAQTSPLCTSPGAPASLAEGRHSLRHASSTTRGGCWPARPPQSAAYSLA